MFRCFLLVFLIFSCNVRSLSSYDSIETSLNDEQSCLPIGKYVVWFVFDEIIKHDPTYSIDGFVCPAIKQSNNNIILSSDTLTGPSSSCDINKHSSIDGCYQSCTSNYLNGIVEMTIKILDGDVTDNFGYFEGIMTYTPNGVPLSCTYIVDTWYIKG